jgi:hypothetical protein
MKSWFLDENRNKIRNYMRVALNVNSEITVNREREKIEIQIN